MPLASRLIRHVCHLFRRWFAEKCSPMVAKRSPALPRDDWYILQRWQAYEAEGRANLLRIAAIGALYLIHLWSYLSASRELPGPGFLQLAGANEISDRFHAMVTLLAVAWAVFAMGVLIALQQKLFPRWLPYLSTAVDITLLTGIICLGSVSRSPLVAGYFLVLILVAMRLDLRLLWFSTAGCAVAFLCVLGCAKWPATFGIDALVPAGAEIRIPRYHQVIVIVSIVLAGVMLGQLVRRVRHLAQQLLQQQRDNERGA